MKHELDRKSLCAETTTHNERLSRVDVPDIIAAVATGGAVSAIGIVRVSGPGSIEAADKIFRAAGGLKLTHAESGRMYYGELSGADGSLIDMCLCFVSHAPKSYTGEDTVELHCHGSPVVLAETLRALIARGVRQAEAGEFTKRAFLNGRMDLTQAEAVIDLIESETAHAVRNAAGQLCGAICVRLNEPYDALLDVMAHFHALIDYPDEDIDEFEMQNCLKVLLRARETITQLLSTCDRGRLLRTGIPAVIVGRPNTGKSSMLNALLGFERAIVTDVAGTTRDTLEEKAIVGGILLRLIDTAGLRRTEDQVEKLGVMRTINALRSAKLAIVVLDGSQQLQAEDYEVLDAIPGGVKRLIVLNKSDLPVALDAAQLEGAFEQTEQRDTAFCSVCALTGEGLDSMEEEIKKLFPDQQITPTGEVLTSERQAEALRRVHNVLGYAIVAIEDGVTPDAVLTEVEAALAAIGEVTGKTMRDDVISRIFERFCVGK